MAEAQAAMRKKKLEIQQRKEAERLKGASDGDGSSAAGSDQKEKKKMPKGVKFADKKKSKGDKKKKKKTKDGALKKKGSEKGFWKQFTNKQDDGETLWEWLETFQDSVDVANPGVDFHKLASVDICTPFSS